ncbi:MAG: N(4)-(beta-N-acetylglucosaminyl)-L-asparaginase [Planctomycetota bacterium]|jgi:N4-(beta-N-acetylglucosaminyl)-L-asparaginase
MTTFPRRTFLTTTAAALGAPHVARAIDDGDPTTALQQDYVAEGAAHRGVAVISSGNGLPATERAFERIGSGWDCVNAVVDGVGLVEADPNDMSVGLGGLPNEDGVVQLDASVMHGPSHRAGAVGALENVLHAARVALLVLERTDHVMLVGEGAKRFALEHGFPEQDLLTDAARSAWLRWRENLSGNDDRFGDGQALSTEGDPGIPHTDGTIHCSAVDASGDIGSCTTTSGLSWKIPGRVGDSPIIGAGMYCDNEIGAAGATGRGEAVIQSCGAFAIVREMEAGLDPTAACLKVLERIASRTVRPHLLNERGEPNFNVSFYALRKDGAWGAASMRPGGSFAIHDGDGNRRIRTVSLFD